MATIISVEGNIGVGKSTLIKNVMKYYENNDKIVFYLEDLTLWNLIKDLNGNSIFELYYKNQKEYSFPFEITTLVSRLKQIKNTPIDKLVIVTERCVFTDRDVFAKMLYEQNNISEINYKIYNLLFDTINMCTNIIYFYINIEPEIAYNRTIERNREGELVDFNFLQVCHDYHNKWLNNKDNVIIVNDLDLKSLTIKLKNLINKYFIKYN